MVGYHWLVSSMLNLDAMAALFLPKRTGHAPRSFFADANRSYGVPRRNETPFSEISLGRRREIEAGMQSFMVDFGPGDGWSSGSPLV